MTNNLKISVGESNLVTPLNHIHFWERGEMAYTALIIINEHKAKNELEKAKILLDE